jgi:5,10-methenyltetrahydrofolate synthetase
MTRDHASPPCFLHAVDPAYSGLVDEEQARDVARWRKAERARLLTARQAMAADLRQSRMERIARLLETAIGDPAALTISLYWPFRGEPDPRGLIPGILARGGRTALPVVVARGQPLLFRGWRPGEPLTSGVWNIPIPAADAPVMQPDIVVAPVLGFDAGLYRLGYGGGFFDRTLATMAHRPRILGVGYDQSRLPTIFPQPHDIPMDLIVTESGVLGSPRESTR